MVKVVVMCGGRGVRLRPVTDTIPKPLVMLGGKPIVHHLLERYVQRGFREFVLCLGYRGEMVRAYFSKYSLDGNIEYSDAGEEASILERLTCARELIGQRAFVAYGDTLVNVDLAAMLKRHIELQAKATITIAPIRSPFGLVETDAHSRVQRFSEKPVQQYFIGHFLLEQNVLEDVPEHLIGLKDGAGLVKLFQGLSAQKDLGVFEHTGPQITFNTRKELEQAKTELSNFYTYEEAQR